MDGLRKRGKSPENAPERAEPQAQRSATELPPLPSTTSYFLTRVVFARLLGLVAIVSNVGALHQNLALLGQRGLYPACRASSGGLQSPWSAFLQRPSLFYFTGCTDAALIALAAAGSVVALAPLLLGSAPILPVLLPLWLIQVSFVNLGSPWYAFGWETQLLETMFWALPSAPLLSFRRFEPGAAPSTASAFLFRVLIAKIMLGAGLIKLRGDSCWRALGGGGDSCMDFHYETQPNPGPLSAALHALPPLWHAAETFANHAVELGAPLLLLPLLPRACRLAAGVLFIGFQALLILSGNLSFLNWLTILPALWALDDAFLAPLFPRHVRAAAGATAERAAALKRAVAACACAPRWGARAAGSAPVSPPPPAAPPPFSAAAVVCAALRLRALPIAALLLAAAWNAPIARNLLSRTQAMNRSFGAWHLCNTYGAFGAVGKVRLEVVWAGQGADGAWREYEFLCKPGNVSRAPCLITPYHLRLDWLMWFSAMGTYQAYPWAVVMAKQLLEAPQPADNGAPLPLIAAALRAVGVPVAARAADLLALDPFAGGSPPEQLRATLYEYRFAPRALAAAARARAPAPRLCAELPASWGWGGGCAAGEGEGSLLVGSSEVAVGTVWARRKVGGWLPALKAGDPSMENFVAKVMQAAPQF